MILDQQEFEYRVLYDGTTQFVLIIIKVIHSQLDLEDLHTTESSSVPSFCAHAMEWRPSHFCSSYVLAV